jgi:hypothetical protein
MDENGNKFEALRESMQLLAGFSHASAIGFAVFDRHLHYLAINKTLAAMNGVPVEAHLGNTLRDICGDLALQIEVVFRRILVTGKPEVPFEVSGLLPRRTESGHWLMSCFPSEGRYGRVKRVCRLVVDVTKQRKLDAYFHKLTGDLLHERTRETFWQARELHDSIEEYHVALGVCLDQLTRRHWEPEDDVDELGAAVRLMDQRILRMQELVSAVAELYQIEQRP